jgi:phosphate transport system ATP-binding protein
MKFHPKESQEIIEAQHINFFYGQNQALKDISLSINRNAVTALIGPSGCGKTTFLRLINRMNDLVEGTRMEGKLLIEGENIYTKKVDIYELRKYVGMVFQKPNPFPKSIYENVAFGLRINHMADKKNMDEIVEKSLRQAALWDEVKDHLKKSAYSLSGGQQQRLCIARTLAIEPSIILMDEPTSALDPISTAKVEELIYQLKSQYSIVIVTHNMQQAGRISDETGFFYMGKLIEMGKTKKIFTNPKMEQTQNYITGRFG